MSKSKVTTSSSHVTACPECDSGSLVVTGSTVECLSCGWQHTAVKSPAKKPRTGKAKQAAEQPTAPAASVASQLAAVVSAPAKPAKGERKARQMPTTMLVFAKPFSPRTNQTGQEGDPGRWAQAANWRTVTDFLAQHDGKATYEQLVSAILDAAEAGGYEKTCNARGFVQGRVRGGHLAAVQ